MRLWRHKYLDEIIILYRPTLTSRQTEVNSGKYVMCLKL